jgi:putative flippase GtrA
MLAMSDLERRGSYTPRRSREQRAYRLAVVGGIAGAVGVVGFALAIFGVIGSGLPILALIIAAVCAFLFRRSVSS